VAVYDVNACMDILMGRDGMDAGDAAEHLSINLIGSYLGDKSPVFVTFLREKTDGSGHDRAGGTGA